MVIRYWISYLSVIYLTTGHDLRNLGRYVREFSVDGGLKSSNLIADVR